MTAMWFGRLIAAFLAVAAVLIAGYAPYTVNMLATLAIAGQLLLGAAAAWIVAQLARRLAGGAG